MHGGEEEAGELAGLWPDGWGIWKAFCLGGQKEYWYIWFGGGGGSEFIIDVVFALSMAWWNNRFWGYSGNAVSKRAGCAWETRILEAEKRTINATWEVSRRLDGWTNWRMGAR